MFPIIVNDGQTPFPEDDIYYIVCKEGVYLKKRLGVMESIAPVKQISILDGIETMAKMHIKKIPATKAQQVINFFKAVYKEYYGEAIVLLFYNQETKQHKIVCPFQEVSAGGADYSKGMVIEGWDMIGTIHSHASMSAFHSGIDDSDEKNFDGLHITFGNMRDDDISVSASIVANGYRVIVDPREYINQMVMTVNVDEDEKIPYAKTWKWDAGKKKMMEIQTAGKYYTRRKFDQRYQVSLSKDPKFDPTWMERVSKKVYTAQTYVKGQGWSSGWYGHNAGYGDSEYWKNWSGHQNTQGVKPKTVIPADIAAKNKDTKKVVDAANPCGACSFNHHKFVPNLDDLPEAAKQTVIEWALDQLDKDASYTISSDIESEDIMHYSCVSCQSKFTVDESGAGAEACCPVCKTDDYLVEITAAEVMLGEDVEVSDEETEVGDEFQGLNMVGCNECNSSFTKDFIVNDLCPSCGAMLDPENHPSNNQMLADTGHYLDSDREAIEQAAAADNEAERLPIPGVDAVPINKQRRKPGILASLGLFNKRNKKS